MVIRPMGEFRPGISGQLRLKLPPKADNAAKAISGKELQANPYGAFQV